MSKKINPTKVIVVVGFIMLISLSLFGIALIYNELVKFSEASDTTGERRELVIISNTLADLYRAESAGNLLAAERLPNIRQEYDSLMTQVYVQIDSLKKITDQEDLRIHLDSVVTLLGQKEQNTFKMFQLLDSINKRSTKMQQSKTTILSKKDIDDLDRLLKETTQNQDTTVTIKTQKKSFLRRVKDVFNKQVEDSAIHISRNQLQSIDSIYVPTVVDTVVQYVNEIVFENEKKNLLYTHQLVSRQSKMHKMNEELTTQINKVLRDVELREFNVTINVLKEKEDTLKRSSEIVSIIGMLALGTTILFIILTLRSISKSQRYRREIEAAKKYAEDLLAARERLILTITHDIKAPLSSIIGYMELLYNSKLQEKERYYLENMQHSAEHVLQLVKNLLDYHALESDKQEINEMSFFPATLLKDISQSFVPLAKKKDIKLHYDCKISDSQSYESDPYRIRQIINNLLSNAVKFTPLSGTVTLSSSIVKSEKPEDTLRVSVKDTGIGIKKEDQQAIFEEFRRLDNGGIEGSGLGLTITRKLVHLLKGSITVASAIGKGTEFVLTIPLKKSENGVVQEIVQPEGISVNTGGEKKILFIDDDVVQLNLYAEILRRERFTPIICVNPVEALDLIHTTRFDMIFTDIQMPGMNGFELVERIRMSSSADSKLIPIIALSAASDISEEKFKEAGFSGFLPKPFTANQMMAVIQKFLGTGIYSRIERKTGKGFVALMKFANDDKDAGSAIIQSFISENHKNVDILQSAFSEGDWETVKQVSHRMLPLMRMISANDVVKLLSQFEKGLQDVDKGNDLLEKVKVLLKEAEEYLSKI